jgi:transposase
MILLLAEGLTITTVAARVGFSRRHVYKWARRFSTDRLVGLRDRRAYATGEEEDGT